MGSVDPARDFRALIKQKILPFGEGELQNLFFFCIVFGPIYIFFPAGTINRNHSCSAPVIVFISLFGCGDPRVLPVCQQLTHRIEQLLSNKNTQYYMKSITCIQAFREQSVKVNKHSHWSSFGGANDDAVFPVGLAFIRIMSLSKITTVFLFLNTQLFAYVSVCRLEFFSRLLKNGV